MGRAGTGRDPEAPVHPLTSPGALLLHQRVELAVASFCAPEPDTCHVMLPLLPGVIAADSSPDSLFWSLWVSEPSRPACHFHRGASLSSRGEGACGGCPRPPWLLRTGGVQPDRSCGPRRVPLLYAPPRPRSAGTAACPLLPSDLSRDSSSDVPESRRRLDVRPWTRLCAPVCGPGERKHGLRSSLSLYSSF